MPRARPPHHHGDGAPRACLVPASCTCVVRVRALLRSFAIAIEACHSQACRLWPCRPGYVADPVAHHGIQTSKFGISATIVRVHSALQLHAIRAHAAWRRSCSWHYSALWIIAIALHAQLPCNWRLGKADHGADIGSAAASLLPEPGVNEHHIAHVASQQHVARDLHQALDHRRLPPRLELHIVGDEALPVATNACRAR